MLGFNRRPPTFFVVIVLLLIFENFFTRGLYNKKLKFLFNNVVTPIINENVNKLSRSFSKPNEISNIIERSPRNERGNNGAAITCPPINIPRKGTKLNCILPGITEDNCQKHQPVGTVAKYSCLPYYEPVGESKSINRICRGDGRWSGSDDVFSCASECGVSNQPDNEAISVAKPSYPGQWPWHAVIFLLKTDGTLQYICAGTLISGTAILTFAHFVTDTAFKNHSNNATSSFRPRSPDSFTVYLGRHKKDQMDYQVQLATLDKIIVQPDSNGNIFAGSIALLILKSEVTNNYFVRPICLTQNSDFVSKHLSTNATLTVLTTFNDSYCVVTAVVGFGNETYLSQNLVRIMSPQEYAGKDYDPRNISPQNYAEFTQGDYRFGQGALAGSGMYSSFKNTDGVNKWYLQGIVADLYGGIGVENVYRQFINFVKVENYMTSWIASTVKQSLPKDENAKGKVTTCPPIIPRKGVKVECISVLSGIIEDNCQKPQSVGTVAKYSCMPFYEPVGGYDMINRKCREDGRWAGRTDSEIFSCAGNCGVSNEVIIPFITNGKSTSPTQWPWHAALFVRQRNGTFTYICGGTLISRKAVLTAAHCVTTEGSSHGGPVARSIDSLRVYFGKHEREQEDHQVQMKLLGRIEVYPSYNINGYDSDIAVLLLESEVTLDYFV